MTHVRVLSADETIASTGGSGGATPSNGGDDLVAAVPELEGVADIDVESVWDELSFHLSVSDVASLAESVEAAATDGVDGVVVTHGTETMAESAYSLDLMTADARFQDGACIAFGDFVRAAR
ncbi:asparaginase domain-containing protein [Natronorubrum daqingense]|uniref:L-asparaginase n=1 Tax=Natronorubrum daqingense TaxID=588898 RepID=A0A1N7EDX5_9EURY|nr:asparaginase domain-containing protein [Natronorubrum daqingense]APX96518.1 hypothetical protein BB347_07755 [Natronorubrum daqingense]SIR86301.1 L-asparaginase [Natronorubrum daqingense]